MAKPRRILKGDSVKLQGLFHLDLPQTGPTLPKQNTGVSATPQVRMIENHPEFAVIEITCSCGTKTYLRCEYAAGQSSTQPPQTQNGPLQTESDLSGSANGSPDTEQTT